MHRRGRTNCADAGQRKGPPEADGSVLLLFGRTLHLLIVEVHVIGTVFDGEEDHEAAEEDEKRVEEKGELKVSAKKSRCLIAETKNGAREKRADDVAEGLTGGPHAHHQSAVGLTEPGRLKGERRREETMMEISFGQPQAWNRPKRTYVTT